MSVIFPLLFSHCIAYAVASFLIAYAITPLILRKSIVDKDGHNIPPGPPIRFPFLRKYPERALHAWATTYGPLYSVWMGYQLFVVINDPHVARDLLVMNGATFSGRWKYFMKNHTILRGGGITASGYNDTWRKHRRIAMWLLTPKAIEEYTNVLDYEAHMLVRSLYNETKQGQVPINPAKLAGRYILNNMLTIIFGTRTYSASDPLVQKVLHLGTEFMQLTGPWSNAIDFYEPLQKIYTPIRSRGRKLHDDFIEVHGPMITKVKERMDAGDDVSNCLVKTLIESREVEKLSWEDMCFIAASFTTGGVHSVRLIHLVS